ATLIRSVERHAFRGCPQVAMPLNLDHGAAVATSHPQNPRHPINEMIPNRAKPRRIECRACSRRSNISTLSQPPVCGHSEPAYVPKRPDIRETKTEISIANLRTHD